MINKIISKLFPKRLKYKILESLSNHLVATRKPYIIRKCEDSKMDGKYGIVTGGTGAIGSAIVLKLASLGALVGVAGRNKDKIDETIAHIKKTIPTSKLFPIVLDVTNDLQVENAISTFYETHGRIDFFINNAGGGPRQRKKMLHLQDMSIIDEILNANLRGSILCSRNVAKYMIKHQSGVIINLSSVMGMNGQAEMVDYSASKSGILGLTRSHALELGKYNVRVNCVSPGLVHQTPFDREYAERHTDRNILGRVGYTDEVASLISFLCSDDASYITGQNFVIDGGRSIGLK